MSSAPARFATPVNAWQHGIYRATQRTGGNRPSVRFTQRLGVDVPATSGRFHIYAGRFCPWSHRLAIIRALTDAEVSLSFVDGLRDGRGWAFRERTGADPVNGFTLLREAYEASEPGFTGHVSVPVLWDRVARRIASNDPIAVGIDLATCFGAIELYPVEQAERIEAFDGWLRATLTYGLARAAADPVARTEIAATLRRLDTRLQTQPFILGDRLTDADLRLWVTLVRYDSGPNAHGNLGPRLTTFEHLWDYARALYAHDAFHSTTDFAAFTAPFARMPDWSQPVHHVGRLQGLRTSD